MLCVCECVGAYYIYTYTYIYIYIYIYIHIYIIYICKYICVCIYVCVCVCLICHLFWLIYIRSLQHITIPTGLTSYIDLVHGLTTFPKLRKRIGAFPVTTGAALAGKVACA